MLGFVTGLAAEARLLRGLPVQTEIGGGGPEGAAHAAETLVQRQVKGLISFGLAGGLDPALPPGQIIIPRTVTSDGVSYRCDPDLLRRLGGASHPALLGGARIAASLAEKAALHAATDASALDLESGAVAAVAARYELPFAVLRAIADPASRALPEAALLALDSQGRIALLPILGSLSRHPSQVRTLIRLAQDAASARKALVERLNLIGPAIASA